jgi:hypothetical protein
MKEMSAQRSQTGSETEENCTKEKQREERQRGANWTTAEELLLIETYKVFVKIMEDEKIMTTVKKQVNFYSGIT